MATFSGIGKLLKDAIFSDLNTSSKNVIGAINELNTKLKFDIYSYNKSTTAGQTITLSSDTYIATDIYALSKITSNNSNGYDNGTAFLDISGHIAYKPDMTASASNIIVMVIHK